MTDYAALRANLRGIGSTGGDAIARTAAEAADAIDALTKQVEDLKRFKAYVHQRLDEADVPTHPDGKHSAAGCRIGDRLDILTKQVEEARAQALEEAAQMAEIDARAISKGTHGRMGSTAAIGDHIAAAIRAIASIEMAERDRLSSGSAAKDDDEQDQITATLADLAVALARQLAAAPDERSPAGRAPEPPVPAAHARPHPAVERRASLGSRGSPRPGRRPHGRGRRRD